MPVNQCITGPISNIDDERSAEPATLPNLQSLLTRAVNNASDDEGWIPLATLGNYLRTASPTFDPRLYGFPRLLPLVEAQAYLTTTGTGGGTRVGLKGKVPDEPPAKKAAPKKKATTKKAAPSK